MKFLILFGSILVPALMIFLQKIKPNVRLYFNIGAILCSLIFGDIASLAIYEIIKDKTVFMTNIHGIFLNPFFLFSGAYVGVYFLYRMALWTLDET